MIAEENFESLILNCISKYGDMGIHVIDCNGNTIIYNNIMSDVEGLKKEEVLGKHVLNAYKDLDENSSTLLNVMKTGRPIINKIQSYLNYKSQKISSINTTVPIIKNNVIIGAIEIVTNVTNVKELTEEIIYLRQKMIKGSNKRKNVYIKKYTFNDIVGNSKVIREVIYMAKKASNTNSNVLIYGETGTGKELFAQSIHYNGKRKKSPFIAQNCAAIPDTLLEGILFGTEKGAFTGSESRQGIIEQADGGTLMLDEVNSMSLPFQAKLLRFLQEKHFRRVGGLKEIPVDVRIIATTNEEPLIAIKEGRLRSDLYHRLNIVSLRIPTLKERIEDINLLCDFFIKKYNIKLDRKIKEVHPDVICAFKKYNWPGNIRELSNILEGAMNYEIKMKLF